MQRLEVSGAVRPIYRSLGVKRLTNLMHKICFTISLFHASTYFEHHVLIFRRSKLYYTASGIITPIGGRPVHKLREVLSQPVHGMATYSCDDTRGCIEHVYLNINQLDALNFIMSLFHASTCFKHHVLIVRRPKLYYTASGIITPVGGRPVLRLREVLSQPVHRTATYRV